MSKKYKIVVSDMVAVEVKGTLADETGKPVPFKFSLTCRRLGVEQFRERGTGDVKELMKEVTTGWEGQRLVLEDDGTPAAFCDGAMDALMDIGGMAVLCFTAYQKAAGAQAKN